MSFRFDQEPLIEESAVKKTRTKFTVFNSGESLKQSRHSPMEKFTRSSIKESKRTVVSNQDVEISRREA